MWLIDRVWMRLYDEEVPHIGQRLRCLCFAPSFNGRTADSGSAYRGSNPWGAAKSITSDEPENGILT